MIVDYTSRDAAKVRLYEKIPGILPILREKNNLQYLFQYLESGFQESESREPSLS